MSDFSSDPLVVAARHLGLDIGQRALNTQLSYAYEFADYLNDNVLTEDVVSESTILEVLASLGLMLTLDESGLCTAAFVMCADKIEMADE